MVDWRGMLRELLNDDSDRMTACEIEFVESLARKDERWEPTERQQATIEKIWNKVFG